MPPLSLSLCFFPPRRDSVLHLLPRPVGAWSNCRAWRANPRRDLLSWTAPPSPNGARAPDSTFSQPCRCCAWLEGRCRAHGVPMPSSDRSSPPAAREGEVDDSWRRQDPWWPWLDLPFPQPDPGATAPPRAADVPVYPATVDLARTTSLRARHARDPGEGAGVQDPARCRLVKTVFTTRRRACAPPWAMVHLRRLARRRRGRQ
jgi:hypothetical protein